MMSGNNDEEKPEGSKVFPLDLASKLTVKPVEVAKGTPLVMTTQPLRGMRVLTQATAGLGTGTSVSGQTISIVPQGMIKQGDGLQRTQLGIISSHGQAQSQTVARPTQITLAASMLGQAPSTGTTYHVPRGPAVVANLATPRSTVATPIRASGMSATAPGYVTAVRQVAPPRTPSPASTTLPAGTTWLSSAGMQVQPGTAQLVKTLGGGGVGGGGNAVLSTNLQRIPASSVSVPRTQVVARPQSNTAGNNTRQAVLHSAQLHSYKTTGGLQALGNAVTLALPNRTQTLVYTGGNAGGATQHFTTSPRIAVTGTINSQRQVMAARPGQVATRLTVPVTMSQGSTRLTVAPATQGIYSAGTRISAVTAAPAHTTVIGTSTARIAVTNQQSGNAGRIAVSSPPGTLLAGVSPVRANNPGLQQQQQPSTVVIATQAGRLGASVVSLHPVMVANSAQAGRTIQTQGPKVITQPSQGPAIQLAQVPTISKLPSQQQVTVTVASTPSTRTINVTPAAIVSQRPISMSQAIPIAKVYPQGTRAESVEGPTTVQNSQPGNVYIHTAPVLRRTNSPGPVNAGQVEVQRNPTTTSVATYSLPSGTTYFYETGGGYPVTGSNLVARAFTPSSGSFAAVPQSTPTQLRSTAGITTQVHGIVSGQPIQFNPVMVVEQKRGNQYLEGGTSGGLLQQSPTPAQQQQQQQQQQQEHNMNPLPSIGKVTSSPRPSILRKRDNEGSPLKAAKNLAPVLANLSSAPVSPPSRPDSRGNCGNSSGGSTTISATSSPGLGEHGDDSLPLPSKSPPAPAAVAYKLEQQVQQQHHRLHHHHHQEEERPAQEMSPRKKPRKQQLTGNDLHEPKFNIDDMQFLSENKIKREPEESISHGRDIQPDVRSEVTVKKPAPASLLNSYRQTWKSTHNHYLRYTDVKPKDERRPTIIDLANQSHVLQKIKGWKIYHLSTQMEDLSDLETQVYDKLSSMLKLIETKDCIGHDRDFNRVNELIKGNMQRSKIINDSVVEAKSQVMKIFDHEHHVSDIINRCASKRNFKKREKF